MGATHLVKDLFSFTLSVLLARLLAPSDFGLVGMVTVFVRVLETLQDLGLGQAVVYFDHDEAALRTYSTLATGAGVCMAALGFCAAWPVASFYREPRLIPIMQVLSLTLALGGLRAVPQGLLAKRFRFRELAFVETSSGLVSGLVAVALAWRGFGAWSLVVNVVLMSLLRTLALSLLLRPAFTWRVDRQVARSALRWGLPLTGSTLVWQCYDNADFLVVGKLLGPHPLGHYSLAFRLATMVNEKISAIVARVSFPAFSAMQRDVAGAVGHWLSLTHRLALVNFPLLAALAMSAEDFVPIIFGVKWLPAVRPLQLLCVVGAMKTVASLAATLVSARGRTDISFAYSCLNLLLLPAAFVVGCKLGSLVGVAVAWCLVYPLVGGWLLWRACRLVGVAPRAYLKELRLPMGITLTCCLVMLPPAWWWDTGVIRLAVRALLWALCVGAWLWSRPGVRAAARRALVRETP